jgi:threonine/homoserine/homoserine lactone efflux protein
MTLAHSLLAYTLAAGLLTITPGLDTALILRLSMMNKGYRALAAGFGICSGLLCWGAFAAFGLATVLAISRLAYDVLRFAGGVYLMYLGISFILKARHQHFLRQVLPETAAPDQENWYLRGVLTNLLNPKIGIFYLSFLPQFIPSGMNVPMATFGLTFIHALESFLWFGMLILATRPLNAWLTRPRVVQCLDAVTGTVMLGFGLKLALNPEP